MLYILEKKFIFWVGCLAKQDLKIKKDLQEADVTYESVIQTGQIPQVTDN